MSAKKGNTKGGTKDKAGEYFDHLRVDEATVKELTRRLLWANLSGTEKGQAGIPGGHGAQAADLILLAWAMADATEQEERDDILQAIKEAAIREVDAAWRAVADAALDRLALISGAAGKGAGDDLAGHETGAVSLADLTRSVFADVDEHPSIHAVKARMAALFDMAASDESEACDVQFVLFDELQTLYRRWPDEVGAWLEIAREAAFARTAQFRAALDGEGASRA